MTVRGANYPRRPRDDYPTPVEVVITLLRHIGLGPTIYDPACGKLERIVKAVNAYGLHGSGDDIRDGYDFLKNDRHVTRDIVTNPPFGTAGRTALRFIEHALEVTRVHEGRVAMLLPVDFDSGKTRRHVFDGCPQFACKLVLLDRIKWFRNKSGSLNHAWYIWSWKHRDLPTLRYARIETHASVHARPAGTRAATRAGRTISR